MTLSNPNCLPKASPPNINHMEMGAGFKHMNYEGDMTNTL